MDKSTIEVLICGAGAAGLTLAIDLARRGIAFRLIEKLDGPFQGSRGKGIQPRSQEVFEDLDVLDRLVAAGGLYPMQREYQPDGSYYDKPVIEPQPPTATEPYHLPLMVPQFLTESVLRERLAELGHRPHYGCELRGIEQDDSGVDATIVTSGKQETLRVDYLVGCDGGRSFVRHALDIDFPGKTLGIRAVVADLTLCGLNRDAWHCFGADDMQAMISLCPLAGTELFQLQAPVPFEGDIDISIAGLNQMIKQRCKRDDIQISAIAWASVYVMNARLAEHYCKGRVLLAGDAAHTHPPTGGQGLNTSVQDAYNLGWKIAAVLRGAPESLLDTYEEERRPIAAQVLGMSTQLLEAAKRGNMQRGREVNQLGVGYPDSSLAFELPQRAKGLLAGDRAPDAPLCSAAGQQVRLFDLFKGPHWTLLAYETECRFLPRLNLRGYHIGPRDEMQDEQGHVRQAYGLTDGDLVLVRPDGYIGAIIAQNDMSALESYLARVGLFSA